jgi:hypothetical protein
VQLPACGWAPQLMVGGLDPNRRLKHMINVLLKEASPCLPVVRMDREACQSLIIFFSQSPMLPDFQEDKCSEANLVNQRLATHLSNCFYNIV